MRIAFFICVCWLCFPVACFAAPSHGQVPVPVGLELAAQGKDPVAILSGFVGVPYRVDGAVDDTGRYTLLADTSRVFSTPGFNCSGFLLQACRFLFQSNIPIAKAGHDRLGDSGPTSRHGHDWDYGWDLIMNLSEGRERQMLLPGGEVADLAKATGFGPKGFDLHAPETWQELPARIRAGYVYLVSFNKASTRKGYTVQHYHVALVYRSAKGALLVFQATPQSRKVTRRDIASEAGRAVFLKSFANTGNVRKYINVIEVRLPG